MEKYQLSTLENRNPNNNDPNRKDKQIKNQRKYGELLGVGPGQLSEFLDGDPSTIVLALETALVDDIGGFLSAFGDDEVGAEVVGGGFQVGERELRENRHASRSRWDGVRSVGRERTAVVVLALVVVVVIVVRARFFQGGRFATAHYSVELTQCPTSASCLLIIIDRQTERERGAGLGGLVAELIYL